MESRRKTLGRKIKRARQVAGYSSQKAFADAIGVSETSVANAERGSELVGAGDKVFVAIEIGLSWPEDCTLRYLETGDERVFVADPVEVAAAPDDINEAMLGHLHEQYRFLRDMQPSEKEVAEYVEALEKMWRLREQDGGRYRRTAERFRNEVEQAEVGSASTDTERRRANGSS